MSIVKVEAFRCDRCGHTWLPRKHAKKPRYCPSCHSPYWDAPTDNPSPWAGTGESRPRRILPTKP
jgi:hypothetical protein